MNTPPITIEVPDAPAHLHAGERTTLTVVLGRPAFSSGTSLLRQVRCKDANVRLDADLFPHELPLRRGESYRLTLPIEPTAPGAFDLSEIQVEADGEFYSLPRRELPVRPALSREVRLQVEAICAYEQDVRILIRLEHVGSTPFHDLELRLEPAVAVRAGLAVLRFDRFDPGAHDQIEAVLVSGPLTLQLTALAGGHPVACRRDTIIQPAPPPTNRAFRFLEPRRLSIDQITLRPSEPADAAAIAPADGVYPVRGKEHYQIVIRPSHPRARSVILRELPERVHVSHAPPRHVGNRWEIEVFVSSNEAFTLPARLFYDVETDEGTLTGEIHLAIRPPAWRQLYLAMALGAGVTLQSAVFLINVVLTGESAWESLLGRLFTLNRLGLVQSLGVLSIPLVWAGLRLYDRIQYRWRA